MTGSLEWQMGSRGHDLQATHGHIVAQLSHQKHDGSYKVIAWIGYSQNSIDLTHAQLGGLAVALEKEFGVKMLVDPKTERVSSMKGRPKRTVYIIRPANPVVSA